jgi:hypothetical protein
MNKNSAFLIVCFIFLFSCEYKERETNNLTEVLKSKIKVDSIIKSRNMEKTLSFELFLDRINKDCIYQKENVKFPLQEISLTDWENDIYDTTYTNKEEYECLRFTSPQSNIIEGKVLLNFIQKSDTEEIILLGVEDTGIRMQFFFVYRNNTWMLIKILDEST